MGKALINEHLTLHIAYVEIEVNEQTRTLKQAVGQPHGRVGQYPRRECQPQNIVNPLLG